ncbi:MAG: hypothetical protein BYD32DRAFT_424574 [Podila humilis]|nr:MAG: hypothetical protein BYD32DRAFT_424574 [Podila humilis]
MLRLLRVLPSFPPFLLSFQAPLHLLNVGWFVIFSATQEASIHNTRRIIMSEEAASAYVQVYMHIHDCLCMVTFLPSFLQTTLVVLFLSPCVVSRWGRGITPWLVQGSTWENKCGWGFRGKQGEGGVSVDTSRLPDRA